MKLCLLIGVLVTWLGMSLGSLQKGSDYANSLGQEVLEVRSPVKELPPDLEEEPSAESDSDEEVFSRTTTTIQPATKKEIAKKPGILFPSRRSKSKDIEKIDNIKREDEEAKIEKELADIYKEPDYNLASSEEALKNAKTDNNGTKTAQTSSKPALRSNQTQVLRENKPPQQNSIYQFQPKNLADKHEVEKFRTSVDEVRCDKSVTKLANAPIGSLRDSSPMQSYNNKQLVSCILISFTLAVICH